jgi:NADP-dependent 3-hydroxy acid dehydrogenase YdfG
MSARPTALITGASSGIGNALAHCFAAAGHDLVLVARSADKLQALATELKTAHGCKVVVEPTDLAQPEAAGQLFATLKRKRLAVDVLVNCAGVLAQNKFASMTPAQHQSIIDLNISGLTTMLAHFVPPMVKRGRGRVLNVASIAAFQPIPMLATYAASKAYVLSLTESLAEELKGSGVTVTAHHRHAHAHACQRCQRPVVAHTRVFDRCCGRRSPRGIRGLHARRCHLRARCRQPRSLDRLTRLAQMVGAAHRRHIRPQGDLRPEWVHENTEHRRRRTRRPNLGTLVATAG